MKGFYMPKELSFSDKDQVDALVSELQEMKFETERLMNRVLDGVLDLVPAAGTCSLLRLNRFFSELENGKKGECIEPAIHRRPPPSFILKTWENLTYKSISDIEAAIYKNRDNDRFGVARRRDVLDEINWKTSILFTIARKAGVNDLAYLWIRCAANDLWIVCLRRRRYEPLFSDYDVALLKEFGEQFYRSKRTWYLEGLRNFNLTKKECQVITYLEENYSVEEVATKLKITVSAVRDRIKSIHKKTGGKTNGEVIRILKNKQI